ncbi:carbonic anhydrase 13-like [Toxorhynchites rutilus septentrionalis]|uniref:carbonic anhydrase 13-like n=1 Tax=Toxorhynchites rutilus septentrionalis TaxID=329112 RepID=UPI002478EF25|nr:carbonic anhydrase 13-like [Toxorhynchites rutilus septentrionalis]
MESVHFVSLLLVIVITMVPVQYCLPFPLQPNSTYDPDLEFINYLHRTHDSNELFEEQPPFEFSKLTVDKTLSTQTSNITVFSYREGDKFGPSNWGALSASCEGIYQSPVSIVTNRSLIVRRKRALDLVGLQHRPRTMQVLNEGGSGAFFPEYNPRTRPRLRGGPLKVDYLFYQFHYHLESEHTLDGQRSAAEVHLVFHSSLYETFQDARDQVEGVAVIALTYDVLQGSRIESLNKWTLYLDKVTEVGSKYRIPPYGLFTLADVTGDVDWPYFYYEGSLTTPPCSETVLWIVASERMMLSRGELRKMRQLEGRGGELMPNSRPIQAVNQRRIFLY